SCNTS
ncbi:transcription termination/antitermination factor NusG, partial [Vibrio parahaemolyticus EKP-021]